MPRSIEGSVVVITGASSGIGRATALRLAREGAAVVLTARRKDALDRLAGEIQASGGRAVAFALDMTDEPAVRRLAATAIETFGRIDVWINNASVFCYGRFLDIPSDDFRRVLEVNVLGYANGARTVLPIFREQGHGTLINVASVDSQVPQPEALPYVASKHAVRAMGMNLRQELAMDGLKDIHVVTVHPAAIDTPLFGHAANYTGKAARPPRPIYPPEMVADRILDGIRDPRDEVHAGAAGLLGNIGMKLAPSITERLAILMAADQTVSDEPVPPTSGNLYTPSEGDDRVRGGWLSERMERTRSVGKAIAAGVGLTATVTLARRALKS